MIAPPALALLRQPTIPEVAQQVRYAQSNKISALMIGNIITDEDLVEAAIEESNARYLLTIIFL